MFKRVFRARMLLASLMFVGSACISSANATVKAEAPATIPLTITAICTQGSVARMRIANPNPAPIDVSWIGTTGMDSASASYGYTTVEAPFDLAKSTPAVLFSTADATQAVAVSQMPCAAMPESCVDGFNRANLTYDWSANGAVTIKTVDNAPLCEDVPVVLSAYTLPVTYDGSGIFDDSSIPQNKYASTTTVMTAGTNGNVTLTIAVPNACTDYQLDAYYGPEITTVSYSGQGAQLIYGRIYTHTLTDCTAGVGGGHVEGASTTTPAAPVAAHASAVLADTGASAVTPTIAATVLGIAALGVYFPALPRLQRLFRK